MALVSLHGAFSNLELSMNSKLLIAGGSAPEKSPTSIPILLGPKEAAQRFKMSTSWLAKRRLTGDGPPYIKIGRSIRYSEIALLQWMKSRQRLSTSEA